MTTKEGAVHWLLNSAVLAAGAYGEYRYEPSSWAALRAALDSGTVLTSRIGYPETAKLIERETGWRPPISREPSVLAPGDTAYIVRLRYRVDPRTKGAATGAAPEGWEIAFLTRIT